MNSTMRGSPAAAMLAAIDSGSQSEESKQQGHVWFALLVLGGALFLQQFVTLGKIKRALLERAPGDPVNTLSQKVGRLVLESWRAYTTPADLAIAAVILVAVGYLVWAEVKRGAFTTLLDRADSSNRVLFGFLALATAISTRCYLSPGQVFMGDSETHMLRSWMFAEHIRNLDAPVWTNAWYGGIPLLANYSPLYFITTALLTIALGDIHLATKLLLWGCHVASVFAMFWFLREVTRRNLPALVGALAYALTFLRLHILLYQGDLQLSVVFALLPLLLLLVERYFRIRTNARVTFVLTTVALAVLIVNHHGYAFFALVLLAVYLVARLAVTSGSLGGRFRILVMFGCAEVAALLITSFLWAPFMFAMAEHRGIGNSAFPILIPNLKGPIMLVKLLRWTLVGDGSSLGYLGLSILLLAVIGIVHGLKQRTPAVWGLASCALASLLMARNNVHYNIKNVDFFMIFICALPAWAVVALVDSKTRFLTVEAARKRWGARFPARVAAVCIGLMAVDLGPTTFQSVFRENYEFKQPMYQKTLALDGPYKVIERQVLVYDPNQPPTAHFDSNKLGIPSAYAPTQTPLGFFHEGAGRSFGYNVEIVKNLHRDLNESRFSELSATGLYLLGVKYVIFRDRYQWFTPSLDSSPLYSIKDGILQLSHATPLLLSRRVVSTSDISGYPSTDLIREGRFLEPATFDYSGRNFRELVEPLMATMHVDRTRGTADTLITRDGDLREELTPSQPLEAEIVDFSTDLKRVRVRYRSNVEAFGQLPYNFFPYLRVEVDGLPVKFYRSAMNQILLRVPAGEHVVAVRGINPPLLARLMWLGLAVLILVSLAPRRLFASVDRSPA